MFFLVTDYSFLLYFIVGLLQSGTKAERTARRNVELGGKKLHVPQVDHPPLKPPPVVIAVSGPPGVSVEMIVLG